MKLEELGYLSIGSQMRRIYEKLQNEADKIYRNADIEFKSSWFPVYYVLLKSNRTLGVMEITEKISYTRITVKNVVRDMEKMNYVQIHSNPIDSRSKLISLTTKGEHLAQKLEKVWTIIQAELEKIFGIENGNFLAQLKVINERINQTSIERVVLKKYHNYGVRNAKKEEFERIGELLVEVYSALKGFPKIDEQSEYYDMLRNVGALTQNPNIEILVAVSELGHIGGAVVYFNDMKDYGSGGTATQEKNACGFRLLGVDANTRGYGLGKILTKYCIEKGLKSTSKTMVIHTTNSMKLAWGMYERLGFKRADDLDFMQGKLPVFGFRLKLKND
jgi:DNA-binding MarR family transcriptional regulator/GNAT superfamily N-acetyltransferase